MPVSAVPGIAHRSLKPRRGLYTRDSLLSPHSRPQQLSLHLETIGLTNHSRLLLGPHLDAFGYQEPYQAS